MHDQRGPAHAIERRAGAGVEIEVQIVGTVVVGASGIPLVQIDAAEGSPTAATRS
jgi:hypothetical protein